MNSNSRNYSNYIDEFRTTHGYSNTMINYNSQYPRVTSWVCPNDSCACNSSNSCCCLSSNSCCCPSNNNCNCNCNNNCNCSSNSGTVFSCGQSSETVTIPVTITTPIPVSTVSINTSNLCSPSVKIDFSSTINFSATLVGAILTLLSPFVIVFQLSKISNFGSKIGLRSWSYTYTPPALSLIINSSAPFNFTYVECDTCPGCYTYSLDIISVTPLALSVGSITTQSASISNSTLCATAISR